MRTKEIINGYPVKNWCVMCGNEMKIDYRRYLQSGNYCGSCSAKCQKGAKVSYKANKKAFNLE